MKPALAHARARVALVFAIAALVSSYRSAPAQQPPSQARGDSTPLRPDYRDLDELLQKLPSVAPPAFDEARARWLGALPLACLDRLQPRPGGRAGGRGLAPVDTTTARAAGTPADSTTRASGVRLAGAPAASNNAAGYFWVATYSLRPDHDRLRAFWGCNDWHSAVGSTWVAVHLLKRYPNGVLRELTREKLNAHLGKSNLDGELAFFRATAAAINPIPSASQTGLFERPYGFAWLLKLQSELRTWPPADTQAKRWAANVAPLAAWMADSLAAYVAKLVEPVRTGSQNNTAYVMTLALDYADLVGDTRLRGAIIAAARRFYVADKACATQSERVPLGAGGRGGAGRGAGRGASADSTTPPPTTPNDLSAPTAIAAGRGAAPAAFGGGGPEIVSPCLSEAALMSRVSEPRAYLAWLGDFLPPLQSGRFAPLTEAISIPSTAPAGRGGAPADTSPAAAAAALAAERARLAALSFSRAQAMERIAHALPAADPRVPAWHRLSAIQAARGFELMRDDAAGIYWLPAQVLLYETVRNP